MSELERELENSRREMESLRHEVAKARREAEELRQALDAARVKQDAGDNAFKRFSDSGMIGIGLFDRDGVFEFANNALLEMIGSTSDEIRRITWASLPVPGDADRVRQAFEELKTQGGCFPFEAEYVRPDGDRFWALFFGVVLEPGKTAAFVLDMTRRHALEQETQALNRELQLQVKDLQLLATIVESSQDAIVGMALDGSVTSWNAGAAWLYGYVEEEILGRSISILAPAGLSGETVHTIQRLRRGERIETFHTERLAKNGHHLDVSLTVSPIRDSAGSIVGASAISRDITEQTRLERDLHERNEQIETQAEELESQYEELQVQHEELGRQDRQRNEFLAMLAHELRNPLAPIMAAAEIMRLRGLPDPQLERQRDVISRQVRHLVRLVDDLLDVARIVQGKVALRREMVDLAEVVDQALQISGALIEERGHQLSVSLPSRRVLVEGDATRLVQVLCNLLNNSARYTDPGGRVWLTLTTEDSPPTPGYPRPGQAVFRVRDTGRGIVPELIGSIFDVFVQADRTLARSEGGLGVGLTLARSLVEQHSGTISVASEGTGRGSEFVVRLPALPAQPAPGIQSEEAILHHLAARRILIVDDNPDALETLADLLALDGHTVWTATSGPDGIVLAEENRPDLMFLDLGMPVMDGFELARRLRSHPDLKHVPLAAITGYGYAADRGASKDAGFDFHLTKPVDLDALRGVLKHVHG